MKFLKLLQPNYCQMKFYFLFIAGLAFSCIGAKAQTEPSTISGSVEVQGIYSTPHSTPFWFRANQFGSVPLPGSSGAIIGAVHINYDSPRTSLIDWGGSLEVRADLGSTGRATIIEGYGKVKIGVFELKAGRVKDIMGMVDTTLSSGAFSISGNALGIPKLQLSIPDYYQLHWFGDLFAFKGNAAVGYVGDIPIQYGHRAKNAGTYYQQSSLYVRLGRPDWSLKLFGGINHQVFWGNEKAVFGPGFNLPGWKSLLYAGIGKTWNYSKIGNHIGSIDMGLTYDFEDVRVMLYRQNFYDEGALYHLANIKDGLMGVSIVNKADYDELFHWSKFLFEFFCTKNQAGYPTSAYTNSGDENYYNNYEYAQGWSYKGLGLGNPFVSTHASTRTGLPNDSADYFNNNRVVAFHAGAQGAVSNWYFTVKLSYSMNYGTFGTSIYGHTTGRLKQQPTFGFWKEVSQFSSFLEVNKALGNGYTIGCVAALDNGKLLNNSGGLIFKLSRTFN
jgi:hypothetical protein